MDLETGIMILKEDMIQERADARREKKHLKQCVVRLPHLSNDVDPCLTVTWCNNNECIFIALLHEVSQCLTFLSYMYIKSTIIYHPANLNVSFWLFKSYVILAHILSIGHITLWVRNKFVKTRVGPVFQARAGTITDLIFLCGLRIKCYITVIFGI